VLLELSDLHSVAAINPHNPIKITKRVICLARSVPGHLESTDPRRSSRSMPS